MAADPKILRSVHNAPGDVTAQFERNRDPDGWTSRQYFARTTEAERRAETMKRAGTPKPLTGDSDMVQRQKPAPRPKPPLTTGRTVDRAVFEQNWMQAQHAAAMRQANDAQVSPQHSSTHRQSEKGLDMSNQPQNGPMATHKDGALSIKVWRNVSQKGDVYYNTTVQRSYKDAQSDEWRETNNLRPDDLLKVPHLSQEAYQSIRTAQTQDQSRSQQQQEWQQASHTPDNAPNNAPDKGHSQPGTDMQAQHEAAMQQAAPEAGQNTQQHTPSQTRGPKR